MPRMTSAKRLRAKAEKLLAQAARIEAKQNRKAVTNLRKTIRLLEQDFNRQVAPLKAELRKLAGGRTPKAVAKEAPKEAKKRGRRRTGATAKVREILQAAKDWLATSAIKDKSGYKGNISAMLAGLAKAGHVERRGQAKAYEYKWKG